MLTNEIVADLQEKISLARLSSETSVKVDVKTLSLLLEQASNKYEVTLDDFLAKSKNNNALIKE